MKVMVQRITASTLALALGIMLSMLGSSMAAAYTISQGDWWMGGFFLFATAMFCWQLGWVSRIAERERAAEDKAEN
jgi:hypothetical protein